MIEAPPMASKTLRLRSASLTGDLMADVSDVRGGAFGVLGAMEERSPRRSRLTRSLNWWSGAGSNRRPSAFQEALHVQTNPP
jgi:hypothetical protein